MEIPKYIVFRVDVMKKGTSVELTNITDDVEDVILKAEQTEPSTCKTCKHYPPSKKWPCEDCCHRDRWEQAESQTDCSWK